MNVVICGAGEVGQHAGEVLSRDGHSITIIDKSAQKLSLIEERVDARVMLGDGTIATVLQEAGVADADLFLAATQIDEINLLAASIASGVGAGRTVARIHHSAYFEGRGLDYALHFGIDHLVCPEYTTAVAIAQTLRNPGALVVERFAQGQIEMHQMPVTPDASACGKTLADLRMPAATRVALITRHDQAFIPDRQTQVQAGDVVSLVGAASHFDKARDLFHPSPARRKRVVILGGTSMGVWLCRALQQRAFSVRLYEHDPERAQELADKLPWVTVLRPEAEDPDAESDESLEGVDAFIALTNEDEHNILAAARAKSKGVKPAMAVLQRSTYLHLIEHVGIDRAFSPRTTAVATMRKLLDDSPVRSMATLAQGSAEVFEMRVPSGSKAALLGVPLREATFPPRTLVLAVERGSDVFVPGAEDVIEPGDIVVLVGETGLRKNLSRMLTG